MSYSATALLVTLSLLAAVASLNYLVDPFGVFREVGVDLQDRPLYDTHVRMAKAHVVARYRPQAVVLGSSRAEIGLSPDHPEWRHQRVYNLGLPHASIAEVRAYLEHALATGAVRQVVVGLDFFQFNPLLEPRADFDPCRLAGAGATPLPTLWCDVPELLLSRTALMESLRLLAGGSTDSNYQRNGSRHRQAKEDRIEDYGSQHAAFLHSEQRYYNETDLLQGFLADDVAPGPRAAREFEALLRLAHRAGVDLRLFISPSHARQWEVIRERGLWGDFVAWKRHLLAATHRVARQEGSRPYPLWDFADYNRYSREDLPPLDDESARMRWYWESSHYTPALGRLVLDQVLGDADHGLGHRLEPESFEEWMRRIERRRNAWVRSERYELATMRARLHGASRRGTPAPESRQQRRES